LANYEAPEPDNRVTPPPTDAQPMDDSQLPWRVWVSRNGFFLAMLAVCVGALYYWFGGEGLWNVSDREHFIYHRTHADRGLHIGSPVRGRTTGDWIIPVTRRFDRPDGSFGGVVIAAIDAKYFQDFYDGLEVGKNPAIVLQAPNGKVLVRRPFVEANVGRDLSQGPTFQHAKQSPAGSYELTSLADGVRRIGSYEQGTTYPVVVAVTQNIEEMLAPWRQNTLHRLGEAGAIVVLMLGLGTTIWRTTRYQVTQAAKLREANNRFDVAISTMSQGLCLYDSESRLVVVNRRFCEIFRLDPERVRPGIAFPDIVKLSIAVGKASEDLSSVRAALDLARADIATRNTSMPRDVVKDAARVIDHLRQADEGLRDVLKDLAERA